jgi:hypothetical protein
MWARTVMFQLAGIILPIAGAEYYIYMSISRFPVLFPPSLYVCWTLWYRHGGGLFHFDQQLMLIRILVIPYSITRRSLLIRYVANVGFPQCGPLTSSSVCGGLICMYRRRPFRFRHFIHVRCSMYGSCYSHPLLCG